MCVYDHVCEYMNYPESSYLGFCRMGHVHLSTNNKQKKESFFFLRYKSLGSSKSLDLEHKENYPILVIVLMLTTMWCFQFLASPPNCGK